MMRIISALLLILSFSFNLFAQEHPLGTMSGDGIEVMVYDHAFAGRIEDFVASGFVDEATFSSELIMRKYGNTIKAKFERNADKKLEGTISHISNEQRVSTVVRFEGLVPEERKILLSVDGNPAEISITSEDYQNNHFINPTYTLSFNGAVRSYKLTGEACFGLSLHYSMMILGALAH